MEKVKKCTTLDEVREEIDTLDRQIIEILSKRQNYVYQAGQLKKDRETVAAPERVKVMRLKRFQWAQEKGLDLYFINKLFKTITDYFIKKEQVHWDKKNEQLTKGIPMIKAAERNDYKELFKLQKKAYLEEGMSVGSLKIPPLTENYKDFVNQLMNCIILTAQYNNELIGMVKIYKEDNSAFIGRLIVHPLYQGLGLGSRLLDAAEKSSSDCKRFELFTGRKSSKNVRFYMKRGYVPFDSEGNSKMLIFMEKKNR